MTTNSDSETQRTEAHEGHAPEEELEEYGGHIQSRHGSIPLWLLAVYFILFFWALYYLYVYWTGLGPGLDYTVK